jgi:hypothetical protein
MEQVALTNALRQLLERSQLDSGQVSSRLEQARSVTYWERLNPSLAVDRNIPGGVHETRSMSLRDQGAAIERLAVDGYFQLGPLLSGTTVRRMRECIEVLKREDWPAVFAFVYDEFWQVTRVPSLVRLLSAMLGRGYRQVRRVWAFHVAARTGAAGWPPHTDGGNRPESSNRLAIWIPLSDATLDNGCMYVTPQRRLPARIEESGLRPGTYSSPDVQALPQASRALPARAGSILRWDFRLIHWGSVCGDARTPRVSLSVEFNGGDVEPESDEHPLLDAQVALPTLAQRLGLIGRAIDDYQRFEPLMLRYHELAQRLAESVGSSDG